LKPADRLVVLRIGGDVRELLPDFDGVYSVVSMWSDNPLIRKRRDAEFVDAASKAYSWAFNVPCTMRSAVMDTIRSAARIFSADSRYRRRRLVVISDMLEDTAPLRLDRGISAEAAHEVLEKLKRHDQLPDLNGVDIFVAGASARDRTTSDSVEQFWRAYFSTAGASLAPSHYGPMLLGLDQ
jgi:hypothetical protein